MTLNSRQTEILEAVKLSGHAAIEDLATQFDVTLQTIRRDVSRLEGIGLLDRFHGGVRVPMSTTENIAYRQRQSLNAKAKAILAQDVACRIPNHCSIMINLGTTMEAVAKALLQHKGLQVITNNLNVANILSDNPDCEVMISPGLVRHRDKGITGEATVHFMSQFKVDIGLVGISGIEMDGSLRDYDFKEVQVSRSILQQSRETWMVADSSKFGRHAMVELAKWSEIDRFFTDQPVPVEFEEIIRASGVQCCVAQQKQTNKTRRLVP